MILLFLFKDFCAYFSPRILLFVSFVFILITFKLSNLAKITLLNQQILIVFPTEFFKIYMYEHPF